MIIKALDIYAGWVNLLDELLKAPVTSPRAIFCREQLGLQLRIEDASRNLIYDPQRKLNYRFAVAEWLWIMTGHSELEILTRYNSKMAEFSDDGKTLAGAYGPRLFPQWPYVMKKMLQDMETRQAVMQIWSPSPEDSKDIPCTLSFQFLARPSDHDVWRLHLIVTMRSSDAWLGIPYDVFSFTQLQQLMAAALSRVAKRNFKSGELVMNLGSSHLYEQNWETARSIVNAPTGRAIQSPRLPVGTVVPTELEQTLLDGTPRQILDRATGLPMHPWDGYLQVLTSPSSVEAMEILVNLERKI